MDHYTLKKAILKQEMLIEHLCDRLTLLRNWLQVAENRKESGPNYDDWKREFVETGHDIEHVELFLKLAEEAMELMKEALGDDNEL